MNFKMRGRSVIVNLTNGESFTGTVVSFGIRAIRLAAVSLLEPENASLSGEVVIPARMIRWVQVN